MVITLENGNTINEALQHLKMFYVKEDVSLKLMSGNNYQFEFSNGVLVAVFKLEGNKLTFSGLGEGGDMVGARFYWA